MVAIAPTTATQIIVSTADDVSQKDDLSPKQKQRLEEQKAREAKKTARRLEKQARKERRALEKERKEAERERRLQDLKEQEGEGLTYKEAEERQRIEEEQAMIQAELLEAPAPVVVKHVKKSAHDSNRLGGNHMA